MPVKYDEGVRAHAYQLLDSGYSKPQVAREIGCCLATVKSWARQRKHESQTQTPGRDRHDVSGVAETPTETHPSGALNLGPADTG